MKINLFLSVVSVFAVFHLCKAGPLRQRRAAFYIANETACVVDNIVYSNGDPIPTDDPCEACRCRPPGFACVLKECKIKPGCRAVRHTGQCCPEYICGCEHDGRFYKDGEEIKDPKNPCYQCFCQGTSIACAFVDCIYRDECDSVFVPGECCPKYINCTKDDTPDRNLFVGGYVFPSANLLPTFNDESVLPEVPSADQVIELPENPINPVQPEEANDNSGETLVPENSESENVSNKPETPESENLATKAENVDVENTEKNTDPSESPKEEKLDLPKENEDKEPVEAVDETNILLNSESDITKDEVVASSEATTEEEKAPQTTEKSKSEEIVSEATVTEKSSEADSITTEIVEKDPKIRNSASENSKSLKLTDNDQLEEIEKKADDETVKKTDEEIEKKDDGEKKADDETVKKIDEEIEKKYDEEKKADEEIQKEADEKTLKKADEETDKKPDEEIKKKSDEETITKLASESTSTVTVDDLKESSTMEDKIQSEENMAEESQTNAQATSFYMNNAKIKSESAETVTIVVHVKESSKIPTETDFIAETVTPTSVKDENLLKTNDEIMSTNSNEESPVAEENKSTKGNFEIFPTTKQIDETELTTKSPTVQNSEDIQGRSDEADNIALEAEENPVSEENVPNSKPEDNSSVMTTTMKSADVEKEERTDEEITEETKAEDPTSTVIKIDGSRPVTIKIVTDSVSSPKPEESVTELEKEKTEEVTKDKDPKNETNEELIESAAAEKREDSTELKENVEEPTTVQTEEESTKKEKITQTENLESTTKETSAPEEKLQESTPTNTDEKPEIRTNDEVDTEKKEETPDTKDIQESTTKENKPETTTEAQNQTTEESKQTSSVKQ